MELVGRLLRKGRFLFSSRDGFHLCSGFWLAPAGALIENSPCHLHGAEVSCLFNVWSRRLRRRELTLMPMICEDASC